MHIRLRSERRDRPFIRHISWGAAATWMTLFCLLITAQPSLAMDLVAELSAGYDSNPALGDPAEGSGFSVYSAGLGHVLNCTEDLMLDVSLEGRYQDYWQLEDNYRVQAGTTLTYTMLNGRLLTSLMGEAVAFRDHLIEADERNEIMVGLGAEWILTNRLTLGFEQTCRFLNYLNWARPFSGKGQGRGSNQQGKGRKQNASMSEFQSITNLGDHGSGSGNRQLHQLYPPRNNRFLSTTLDLDIFILPSVTGRIYATYGDLNASLDMESYRELQTGLGLYWIPRAQWRLGFEARGSRVRYDSVPENITRVRKNNTIWFLGMDISRFWGNFEVFGEVAWTSGEAPLDSVDYTQAVILCGISYIF